MAIDDSCVSKRMVGGDDEPPWVGADGLVLVDCQPQHLAASRVFAFAKKRRPAVLDRQLAQAVFDPLVRVTEHRFVLSSALR